jgi:hypothetical protein
MQPRIEDLPRASLLSLVARLTGKAGALADPTADLSVVSAKGQTEVTLTQKHMNFDIQEPVARVTFDLQGKVTELKTDFPLIT